MNEQEIPEGAVRVDPARAFQAMQERTAMEMSRLFGDLAAKDAYIGQLQDEVESLRRAVQEMQPKETGEPSKNGKGDPVLARE